MVIRAKSQQLCAPRMPINVKISHPTAIYILRTYYDKTYQV